VVSGGGPASTNVALAANGGVASASSTFSAKYPLGGVIDGDRAGALWGNGGGWADATIDNFPDWLQVNFNGVKTLDSVVVYSLSDTYASGVAPSDTLTSSQYALVEAPCVCGAGATGSNFTSTAGADFASVA